MCVAIRQIAWPRAVVGVIRRRTFYRVDSFRHRGRSFSSSSVVFYRCGGASSSVRQPHQPKQASLAPNRCQRLLLVWPPRLISTHPEQQPRPRPRRSSPRGSAAAEAVDEARAGCNPYLAPGYIDLGISELVGGRGDFSADSAGRRKGYSDR